ncbi:MFS general substrate transporter [Hypoxylon cercidicola]|nr:MFS general substrate transporter [Hypoxylon cercidicola]
MWDTIRESSLGQIVRLLSRSPHLLLPYPEELDSFQLPAGLSASPSTSKLDDGLRKSTAVASELSLSPASASATPSEEKDLEAATSQTWDSTATTPSLEAPAPDVVDWYSASDPANPQNWSLAKKIWVTTQMGLYTFAVYVGSSLYAPSETQVMAVFGARLEAAALGIALYVAGYGLGPLLWSPLSEIPGVGRTRIYVATLAAFAALALGACLVDSLPGLLVLRFLLGFAGSPCLATAGATLDDMYAPWKLPYVLTVWSCSATLGPALGPVVSGFAVARMGWRWSSWELFWLATPVLVVMSVGLPETNPDTILHRRAARLRARTARPELLCEADRKRAHMTPRQVAVDALIKPWQINALDPAVLYTTVYAAVLYATYYSFFEAFPLVFVDMHGFNLGESGLPFLAFVPGLLIAVPGYIAWFRLKVEPAMRREPPPLYGHPESRLFPAVLTAFLAPTGLFIFAWTSRPDIHWIVPILGLMVLFIGVVVSFQCMNFYISRCYPKYSASLFAANTFARSCFAAGSILFSTPMYKALGVGGGVSLLGGFSVLCAFGTIVLWRHGDRLRIRSRFAQSS